MIFLKSIRSYLKHVLSRNGFVEVLPVLVIFYYLYSTSLIPINLYYRFFSKAIFEHYYVNLFTLVSPIILLYCFLRYRPNMTLVVFSGSLFGMCVFSSIFSEEMNLTSIVVGITLFFHFYSVHL